MLTEKTQVEAGVGVGLGWCVRRASLSDMVELWGSNQLRGLK